jgi:hypothetical protein
MRTIASLNGAEFLRAINRTRYAVEKLLNVTGVMKIRKNVPAFTGNETAVERAEMERAQVKKNLNDMLDALLETYPEETYECILALCVLDEGEPKPDGIELIMAAFSLIGDKRVLDFLSALGKSGLFDTEA